MNWSIIALTLQGLIAVDRPSLTNALDPSNVIPNRTVNNYIHPITKYAAISGGFKNYIQEKSLFSTVKGGHMVNITGASCVAGGMYNTIYETKKGTSVINGKNNEIINTKGKNVLSGGENNRIYAMIGEDGKPTKSSTNTISGGRLNTIINGNNNVIGGGLRNDIVPKGKDPSKKITHATISGGQDNVVSASYATVPGGKNNQALAKYSTAMGVNATNEGENSLFINLVGDNTVIKKNAFTVNAKVITLQIGRKKVKIKKNNIARLKDILNSGGNPGVVVPTERVADKSCAVGCDASKGEYCASDSTCKGPGMCAVLADCGNEANVWNRPQCMGQWLCENNECSMECGKGMDTTVYDEKLDVNPFLK